MKQKKNTNVENSNIVKTEIQKSEPKGKHLWVFKITAILLPILFLFILEILLRVFDYGYNPHFFIKRNVNGKVIYTENRKYTQRFFPESIARAPHFTEVPEEKSKNTYRIFVLGSSAALGDPQPTYSFGSILKILLKDQYPNINFEVINAAVTSINSHVVYDIAKDCSKLQPDLFIVYTGNNEVVGPYGAGTIFSPLSSNLSIIKLNMFAKSLRLGQLIQNLIKKVHPQKTDEMTEWKGMEMFLDKQVKASDPKLNLVYKHYKKNLQDIIKLAEKNDTNIILSTVGTNLKNCAPFSSLHKDKLSSDTLKKWDNLYNEGLSFQKKNNFKEAISSYKKAIEIDDEHADLYFNLAECNYKINDFVSAKENFIKARDLDTLRFRADTEINNVIKKTASEIKYKNFGFLDFIKPLENNSINTIPDEKLLIDHVHYNFEGNYLLAKEMLPKVNELLPANIKSDNNKNTILTEKECEDLLAYTVSDQLLIYDDMQKRFKLPPFTNQSNHTELVNNMSLKIKELSAIVNKPEIIEQGKNQYLKALKYDDSNTWLRVQYASFLKSYKQPTSETLEQFNIIFERWPFSDETAANIGMIYTETGEYEKAEKYLKEALKINPNHESACYYLATVYAKTNRSEEAVNELYDFLKINPKSDVAENALGNLLLTIGGNRIDEGIKHFQRALEINPNNFNAPYNLGITYQQKGDIEKSIQYFQKSLEINPQLINSHINLATIYIKQNDIDKAIFHYEEIAKIDPNFKDIEDRIGNLYYVKKDIENSLIHLKKALEYQPNSPVILSKLAWIYATSKDDKYRNGYKALELATNANDQTQGKSPQILEILAAAYAEIGQFDQALALANRAGKLSIANNQNDLSNKIKQEMKFYINRQPYRE